MTTPTTIPLPRPGPLGLIQYAGIDMLQYAGEVSAAKDAEIAGLRAELLKSLADNAPLREQVRVLEDALNAIDKECFSHVDGRDLFAQMHPRNTLDIKRRVDARETWFEGDWLTNLWAAIKAARAARKGEA